MRPLNILEQQMLNRMLSADFPGQRELKLQLDGALVDRIDDNGSLRFVLSADVAAPVERRIPVEAQSQDTDGMWIHALLHVTDGKLAELEIYKDDSSSVVNLPDANLWELLVYSK